MRRTTPARLATYGYVNPAIAAVTGWVLLGEALSTLQLAGMLIILAGVVFVTLPEPTPK
jgi:probable blue pigment (indigoidine) exporter